MWLPLLVFDQKFYFYQWMEWWHFNSAFDINYLICGLVPLAPGCPIKCRTKISLNLIKQNDHSLLRKCCKSAFLVFWGWNDNIFTKNSVVYYDTSSFVWGKEQTVGLLAFSSRKLLIMWLFKHGKISILFSVMIFVIRYFGETHGKTVSRLKPDVFERAR